MGDRALVIAKASSPYWTISSPGVSATLAPPVTLSNSLNQVRFSPDGAYLAMVGFASPYVTIINIATWTALSALPSAGGTGYACAWSPDGSRLAVGTSTSPYLKVYDTATWTIISGTPTAAGQINDCAYSPDGAYLAIAHNGSPYGSVYNTASWSAVTLPTLFTNSGQGVAWNPAGTRLVFTAISASSPRVRVLNTAGWTIISGTPNPTPSCYGVAYAPSGNYLALCTADAPTSCKVYDVSNWSLAFNGGTNVIYTVANDVAWMPDESALVFVGTYATNYPAALWVNTANWSAVSNYLPSQGSDCASVALSPTAALRRLSGTIYNAAGDAAVSGIPVRLTNPLGTTVSSMTTGSSGQYVLLGLQSVRHHRIIRDSRTGALRDLIDQPTLDLDNAALEVHRLWPLSSVTISGNATKIGGGEVTVLVVGAINGEIIAKTVADENGDWSAVVGADQQYYLTYLGDACAPITHGPYTTSS